MSHDEFLPPSKEPSAQEWEQGLDSFARRAESYHSEAAPTIDEHGEHVEPQDLPPEIEIDMSDTKNELLMLLYGAPNAVLQAKGYRPLDDVEQTKLTKNGAQLVQCIPAPKFAKEMNIAPWKLALGALTVNVAMIALSRAMEGPITPKAAPDEAQPIARDPFAGDTP